jgi:hypothetical protein
METTGKRLIHGAVALIIAIACTTYVERTGTPVEVAGSAIANSIIWGAVIIGLLK